MKQLFLVFFIFIGGSLVAQTNRINEYNENDVNYFLYNYQNISDEISSVLENDNDESLLLKNYSEEQKRLTYLIGVFFLNDQFANENDVIECFELLLHENIPEILGDIFRKYNIIHSKNIILFTQTALMMVNQEIQIKEFIDGNTGIMPLPDSISDYISPSDILQKIQKLSLLFNKIYDFENYENHIRRYYGMKTKK
jgi:hypothetical protein